MQEDIERRTVALSVNATKLTGRALAKILGAAVRKIQKDYQKGQTPQGKQSVKKLMNHGASTKSLDLSGDTKLFDRVARKYNVDYAFHKTGPNKYLLFFKAGQADAITACFGEYSKLVLNRGKNRRPSILEQLKTFADRERTKPRQRERKREAVRNER
ncbi:PcfB family protein [Oscillibacter sp.]|uniref:PcfB family protein n=1 Tax=Oscillibacter sp. TaxID=1945593 RepID=UPI0028967F0D|nr:PcfB family protein [Oscillibacter sp.]